jgi:hypothetical protein
VIGIQLNHGGAVDSIGHEPHGYLFESAQEIGSAQMETPVGKAQELVITDAEDPEGPLGLHRLVHEEEPLYLGDAELGVVHLLHDLLALVEGEGFIEVLEGELQLLVGLLGTRLELVELLNQELDVLRHF